MLGEGIARGRRDVQVRTRAKASHLNCSRNIWVVPRIMGPLSVLGKIMSPHI